VSKTFRSSDGDILAYQDDAGEIVMHEMAVGVETKDIPAFCAWVTRRWKERCEKAVTACWEWQLDFIVAADESDKYHHVHKHTDECLSYAAQTGKPFCIAPCAESREAGAV